MGEFYICKVCGNLVQVVTKGGGTLVCCGQPMTELKANTVEASFEKHIPVVEVNEHMIHVRVGSVDHPMTEEHYITWIYVKYDGGSQMAKLKPGMKPEATFATIDARNIEVYAYCNLHGFWKSEI